jgi:hypothetical protein
MRFPVGTLRQSSPAFFCKLQFASFRSAVEMSACHFRFLANGPSAAVQARAHSYRRSQITENVVVFNRVYRE